MTKDFGPFFIVLSSVIHLTEQFKRAKSYSDNCSGTQKSNFLGSKRLLKPQNFEKKGNLSSEKNLFDRFLSEYRL